LPETAPCFEALRVYLVLPFCHIFENDDMLARVIAPFAQAITRLKKSADGRVLDYWIQQIGRPYVERILEVDRKQSSTRTRIERVIGNCSFQLYKPLVIQLIRLNAASSLSTLQQHHAMLQAILDLLKKVHNVS
jgi:hypothetical protein